MAPQPDEAVRAALVLGAELAAEALRARTPGDLALELGAFSRTPFAAFPDGAPRCDADEMATTVSGVHGALSGVVLVSFEPEHALRLIGPIRGPDALDAVRDSGDAIGRAFAEALLGALAPELEWDPVALREGPTLGAVLETHAPPDTAVLSVELAVDLAGERFAGFVYILMDAKLLDQLVG